MNKIKTVIIGTLVLVLCLGGLATGCSPVDAGKNETPAAVPSAPAPEPSSEPLPESSEPEPSYRKIGAEEEKAFSVIITNKTGQEITEIAVKSSEEKEYAGSLVPEGQSIAQDETVMLYYTPSDTGEGAESLAIDPEDEDTAVSLSVTYDIRLTCADESVVELHDFGFSDMTEAELHFADGVAYTQYVSKATGETVNTKEAQMAEKAKREEAAAKEEAAKKEAAKKEAAKKKTQKTPKKPSQNTDDCLDDNIDWND